MKTKTKYYVAAYLWGYIVSLFLSGINEMIYLLPIKVFGVIFAIGFGNTYYHDRVKKCSSLKYILISLRNVIIVTIIVIFSLIIKDFLLMYNIDISFITAPL